MTDRALDDLIAAVEEGQISTDLIMKAFGNGWDDIRVLAAFSGDLNAAKALHEALLPGWMPVIQMLTDGNWLVEMWPPDNGPCEISVENADPARAWLIAILKAYRGMQA